MSTNRASAAIQCLGVLAALASLTEGASASTIRRQYGVTSSFDYRGRADSLSLTSSGIGSSPASNWYKDLVPLGWFSHHIPSPNLYPPGEVPDVIYNNVPFSFTIFPRINPYQNYPPEYKYKSTITGPASDGAEIRGVLNGRFSLYRDSDVVATFLSITGNDMAARFSRLPDITYVVDRTLPNPFPITQLVLPGAVHLNRNAFTEIYVTMIPDPVPEPSTVALFLPLAIALAARRKRGVRSVLAR